jgi:hypothetical protein
MVVPNISLNPFFQIALVDGHFPAELFDGEWFADMAAGGSRGPDDLFPVGFVGEELALEAFHFFFTDHAFEAIKQQHLALGIDEDVLQAVGIGMVEQGFQHQAGPAAERKGLGEGGGMPEIEQVFADGSFGFPGTNELGEVDGKEAEAEYIHCLDPFGAARGSV